jgi:hypothetical protein
MKRRVAILLLTGMATEIMAFDIYTVKKFISKVRDRLFNSSTSAPEDQKTISAPPAGGELVSTETALNSRCTSDNDGDPYRFHWGMFSQSHKLAHSVIEDLAASIQLPRFTKYSAVLKAHHNTVEFLTDNSVTGPDRAWLMVESGMQQQALCLLCAARGIGMVYQSSGNDGIALSGGLLQVIQVWLNCMDPSYNGSFWSSDAPSRSRPWMKGNLSDPLRKGTMPLLNALQGLVLDGSGNGMVASVNHIGQLLWAARGRTPHFYKSEPWGMTIPVCQGLQDLSSVYLVSSEQLYRYVNFDKNRPTNSIHPIGRVERALFDRLVRSQGDWKSAIVLSRNDDYARGDWEVGYSLLNLLVQARSLGIRYKSILLNDEQSALLRPAGIGSARAMFLVSGTV